MTATRELPRLLEIIKNVNVADNQRYTPLHNAAYEGDAPIVQLLINTKADINALGAHNDTPLHIAAVSGPYNTQSLMVLLQAEPHLNAKDLLGQTPLHKATKKRYAFLVDLLLDAKADANVQDLSGKTPLHLAALSSNELIVKSLLKANVNVTLKENSGLTALHQIEYGYSDAMQACKKLLKAAQPKKT